MGLDMYLYKMPRYRETTAKQVSTIESYLAWLDQKKGGTADYSLEEWCGVSEDKLPSQKIIDFYKKHYDTKYWSWDTEHRYGHKMIMQQVADWRKANAIHQWFVENIQDGEDDCRFHREVTESDLESLLNTCKMVFDNINKAQELLPTQSGFFFGSTDYDEWYIDDLKHTITIIEKILKETDFDLYAIYYCSSW